MTTVISTYTPFPGQMAGWLLSEPELWWLYHTAQRMNSIVEVGSFCGRGTHALLNGCNGLVFAIDHFKGSLKAEDATYNLDAKKCFLRNVGGYEHLKLLEMSSLEASCKFADRAVDMIFIDASHLYEDVLADILAWYPKTSRLLCGHDYSLEGVQRALEESALPYKQVENTDIWEVQL